MGVCVREGGRVGEGGREGGGGEGGGRVISCRHRVRVLKDETCIDA